MFCQVCGTENPEGSAFCKGCGSALKIAPAPAAEPVVEPVAATPVTEIPNDTQTNYTPVPTKDPGKGFGIAAMVLGIVGIVVTVVCCSFSYLGLIFSIVSIILGIVAKKKSKSVGMKNTMATVGIILSCIIIGINVLSLLIVLGTYLFAFLVTFFTSNQSSPSYGYY